MASAQRRNRPPPRHARRRRNPLRGLGTIAAGGPVGREFGKLWCASSISGSGDGIALTAAPLLAFSLTRDPRLIAGVTTALTLPYLLFSLPAGVIIDRVDRRRAMSRVDAFRAVLVAGFTVLTVLHVVDILALYACFFLIGTCEAFFRNSAQTLVPQVVPREELPLANSRMMASEVVMNEFAGPMTGGLLFALAPPVPFGIDAVSFALSSTLLSRLRPPPELQPPPRVLPPGATGRSAAPMAMLRELGAGLKALWAHKILRSLALVAAVVNLVSTGMLAILVVFAREDLHVSKTGYGLMLGAAAAGGLTASRAGPAIVRRLGSEWALVMSISVQAVSLLLMSVATQPLLVAGMLALCSLGLVQWNVVAVLLRQTMIAQDFLGRVNGVYRFIAWGTLPIGALCAGFLAGAYGVRSVFSTGAAVMAVVVLFLARMAFKQVISRAQAQEKAAGGRAAPAAGPAIRPAAIPRAATVPASPVPTSPVPTSPVPTSPVPATRTPGRPPWELTENAEDML